MKFLVDIERRITKIKTFEVDADTKEHAQQAAEIMAKSVLWDMSGSQVKVEPMCVNVIN